MRSIPIWIGLILAFVANSSIAVFAADNAVAAAASDQQIAAASGDANQANQRLSPDIQVGIAGLLKVGHWTPVEISLSGDSVQETDLVSFETIDSDGVRVQYPAILSQAAEPNRIRARTHIKFGSMTSTLVARWQRASGEVVEEREWSHDQLPPRLPTDHRIVVAIGMEAGFAEAIENQLRASADPIAYVRLPNSKLPTSLLTYACVDAVVLATGNAASDWTDTSTAEWQALASWVRQGGRIIVSGGGDSPLFRDEDNNFAEVRGLLPGQILGVIQQKRTVGIEGFAEATSRLDRGALASFSMPMADFDQTSGRVELWEGLGTDLRPCIVRASGGLGHVVFVALDLDQTPIASWSERGKLAGRLLKYMFDDGQVDEAIRTEIGPQSHVGNTDLVGQLRAALDQFQNVRLIPFSWIAVIAALYILMIGPFDYWLLNRAKRLEWTWLTFSLMVAGFTLLATFFAFRWKGSDALIHQLTIVDADLATGELRGTTWSHLYSPRTQRVDIAYEAGQAFSPTIPRGQVTSWQGLPGDGFGGLDRSDANGLFDASYRSVFERSTPELLTVKLQKFPIAVWSSRSVSGKWWGTNDWNQALDATELRATADGAISGQLVNPWDVDLTDVLLLHERWAYRIGALPRGATLPIDVSMGADLQALLTDRTVVKGRNAVTPWDRQTTDVRRIVELLSFYEAAKGRAYTQLKHRYQGELDWSNHLWNGQAILWGSCQAAGTTICIDEQSVTAQEARTFCRLLIPLSLP